ncbi:hypothetical protein D9M71_160960 [compost metagenome]
MAAADFLRNQGFTVRKVGMRVVIGPKAKITDDVRAYVKRHRLVLLAELAANDGQERRCHWQITRNGKPLCTLVGEPMTYAEALEAARWRWPDVEIEHG